MCTHPPHEYKHWQLEISMDVGGEVRGVCER